MDQTRLIEETNALLKQLFQLTAEQKAEAERAAAEFEKNMAAMQRRHGLVPNESDASSEGDAFSGDDLPKRFEEMRRQSRERIDRLQEKEQQYKVELLEELRTQSDLLRQILERLAR